ncbi:flagellar basal body rod protein FlgC [Acidovorax facilis]|uniref:flagellar basal body rod protein FlgC n=1 Tax=Acidovorax facilis TaxID=12917 RepID=UPI003CF92987
MNISQIFSISATGMQIERLRIEAAAVNIANVGTVAPPGSSPYQPVRIVARASSQVSSMKSGSALSSFDRLVSTGLEKSMLAIEEPEIQVLTSALPPRMVHEPGHPAADENGWVRYSNVDIASEMIEFMKGTRAYEANVAAMNMTKNLALKTLEIGGAS